MVVKIRAFRMSDYPMIGENSTIRINLGDDMDANLRKVYNPRGHLQLAAHPTGTIGFLEMVDETINWYASETESIERRVLRIHTLAIEPDYQEQRNAKLLGALWLKTVDVAKQEGINTIAVDSGHVENARILPILEKLGFTYDAIEHYMLKEL